MDQPLNRIARPQQPDQAGLRLDKQRLLLAHGFTERRRRRHDIFRQIVQRHGQHLAARRPGPGRCNGVLHHILQLADVASINVLRQNLQKPRRELQPGGKRPRLLPEKLQR